VAANYYPDLAAGPDLPQRLLSRVCRVTAELCAAYMAAGFVHGVLNSDNMSITGESFDYGPYRFLPTYDLGFVAAYFDETGLYAYGEQPRAMLRNVLRLAEALRSLAPDVALGGLAKEFETALEAGLAGRYVARLGLRGRPDTDWVLAERAMLFMNDSQIGFERFFHDLYAAPLRAPREAAPYAGPRWDALLEVLELYEASVTEVPAYFAQEAPCTLLIDEIDSIWSAIAERDDWTPFEAKIEQIRAMA
jgi:uncharacterized protein YdiU (UPF0061 family)